MQKRLRMLIGFAALAFFAIGIYYLPPVHERLAWRIDDMRTRIKYALNPPEQALFLPTQQSQVDAIVTATLHALKTPTPTATPLPPDIPTPTPTVTPTPLPTYVILPGVKYEDQHNRWNYCGPANFSMALTFWGWKGNRDVIGPAVKPNDKDKNVMPYEFRNYVMDNVPGMSALTRMGGDIDVLKRLIAAGFPVIAEKGYYTYDLLGKYSWLGHYLFTTGYDDAQGVFITQDTYLKPGQDRQVKYSEYIEGWRSFNYLFMVIYPTDREAEVLAALGPYTDETWAVKYALQVARQEAQTLTGNQQFFAWFNLGSSHVQLFEYFDAALAYDQAFRLYANLSGDLRPYRIVWYQTWPYWAYYYTDRYPDVINLADTTLNDTISEPVLEESLYWRGRAKIMIGDAPSAIKDYRQSLVIHPGFAPSVQALQELGLQP
ncbi:MAG: C39 family peptidase [Anaerolineales bacterium]|nr:C39 family peptidase [Anaerolineales bacterium]